jgi:hypothetical protein
LIDTSSFAGLKVRVEQVVAYGVALGAAGRVPECGVTVYRLTGANFPLHRD